MKTLNNSDNLREPVDKLNLKGERCIGGESITREYLDNPGLTAETFDQDLQDYQDEKEKKKRTDQSKHMTYLSSRKRSLGFTANTRIFASMCIFPGALSTAPTAIIIGAPC
jgi:acyl-CoA synthetase (AMP-forming)/AMP-acid ligase II